jgi:hypothetical protein
MMLALADYLLFLFGIMMVARDGIEPPTRGFSERRGKFQPLSFNHLPGRLLPNLHDYAQLCTTDSRKTHARKLPESP